MRKTFSVAFYDGHTIMLLFHTSFSYTEVLNTCGLDRFVYYHSEFSTLIREYLFREIKDESTHFVMCQSVAHSQTVCAYPFQLPLRKVARCGCDLMPNAFLLHCIQTSMAQWLSG